MELSIACGAGFPRTRWRSSSGATIAPFQVSRHHQMLVILPRRQPRPAPIRAGFLELPRRVRYRAARFRSPVRPRPAGSSRPSAVPDLGLPQSVARSGSPCGYGGRRASVTRVATRPRIGPGSRPASTSVSGAAGLLRRDHLLAALDRASLKKVTVISAPPGNGKTSLLRAWSDRASKDRQVAFVSVPLDQEDAQRFWLTVSDAIRHPDTVADSRRQAAAPIVDGDVVDGDVIVSTVVSELAGGAGMTVLVIDDLHELRSAEAPSSLNAC